VPKTARFRFWDFENSLLLSSTNFKKCQNPKNALFDHFLTPFFYIKNRDFIFRKKNFAQKKCKILFLKNQKITTGLNRGKSKIEKTEKTRIFWRSK